MSFVRLPRRLPTALAVGAGVALFATVAPLLAQDAAATRNMGGGQCSASKYNCADATNPLPAPSTVWIEEMTWMDVRDAVKAGKTTVILTTGGMEPNGPWLVTGKHNYVLHTNCEAIARKLGNALCAPTVKFVPEGRIDPPSGHMTSPGTISVNENTFRLLLTDIVHSLKQHGFTNIILIGDSGGNQNGQRAVADSLTAIWKGAPVVAHVQEYYDYARVAEHMKSKGLVSGASDGLHDDPVITLNMLIDDPRSVRYDERVRAGLASIDGVSIANRAQAEAWGREIVDFRASFTVDAIKAAIANKGTLPRPTPARRTP
jgi:creatinine amidohydrolase